jgi:hypothetical protein
MEDDVPETSTKAAIFIAVIGAIGAIIAAYITAHPKDAGQSAKDDHPSVAPHNKTDPAPASPPPTVRATIPSPTVLDSALLPAQFLSSNATEMKQDILGHVNTSCGEPVAGVVAARETLIIDNQKGLPTFGIRLYEVLIEFDTQSSAETSIQQDRTSVGVDGCYYGSQGVTLYSKGDYPGRIPQSCPSSGAFFTTQVAARLNQAYMLAGYSAEVQCGNWVIGVMVIGPGSTVDQAMTSGYLAAATGGFVKQLSGYVTTA